MGAKKSFVVILIKHSSNVVFHRLFYNNFLSDLYSHFINRQAATHVCSEQERAMDILLSMLSCLFLAMDKGETLIMFKFFTHLK